MSRIILPAPASFAANRVAVEPASDIVFELFAYFGGSAAASPNMVDGSVMAVTGSPAWSPSYVSVVPDVSYLTPTGILDTADETIFFVARTAQIGGNFSPVFSAYPAAAGLMIALGDNEIRFHASGFGVAQTFAVAANYGQEFCFWSLTLDSGGAVPVKWKNWTYNQSGTFGTGGATRASLGNQFRVGGYVTGASGIYGSDIAHISKALGACSDAQALSVYDSVRYSLADAAVPILV